MDTANAAYPLELRKWILKKTKDKPAPMALLLTRTVSTACMVLTNISEVPFSKLSSALYFFCKDVEASDFTRKYEAQIELAGANADKFAKNLHKFYNDMAREIKEKGQYQAFFEFISACVRARYDTMEKKSEQEKLVIDSYLSLLLQQTEYLRPNKFDFSVVVCGQTSSGELMVTPDAHPNIDEPAMELERAMMQGNAPATLQELEKKVAETYSRHGFREVKTLKDIEVISNIDRVFSNHQCALLPYMNEYTFDLFPDAKDAFTTYAIPLYALQTSGEYDVEALQERLRHRSITLPSNGVVFELRDKNGMLSEAGQPYRSVKMKEMLYDDAIVMIYKAESKEGQLCGYYNTQDGFFYSVLDEAEDKDMFHTLREMVLYLYATQVTRDGPQLLADFSNHFWYSFDDDRRNTKQKRASAVDISVTAYGRGGKPENTYHKAEKHGTGPRAGSDAYESEERAIQGFVRKVGQGRTPSPEAVARAKALGYDLAADETYVQPFIKTVLKLKAK